MTAGSDEVLIVGAGIAGLRCARALAAAGTPVRVLEKSRGVGGRCATRRVDGQPVDHGVAFLHGASPEFLRELREVPDVAALDGWPRRVHGRGRPCQPEAFDPWQRRIAYAEGLTAWPKHLAATLGVELETRVRGLEPRNGPIRIDTVSPRTADARPRRARTLVLTLPAEQLRELLDPLAGLTPDLDAARGLLRMVATEPCLTLIAVYGPEAPVPPWDIAYPEDSNVLRLVSHDSVKRRDPALRVLVAQAHAAWSRRRVDAEARSWSDELLGELQRIAGAWAGRPRAVQTHRWRYGRLDRGSELTRPLLIGLPGGARLGLAGELFAPGGGVEAAWRSGIALADRLAAG